MFSTEGASELTILMLDIKSVRLLDDLIFPIQGIRLESSRPRGRKQCHRKAARECCRVPIQFRERHNFPGNLLHRAVSKMFDDLNRHWNVRTSDTFPNSRVSRGVQIRSPPPNLDRAFP